MKQNVPILNATEKSKFDLTHQVSTTMDFGFVSPLMVDELEPDASVNLRIGQVLRLNPMNSPTFGDIKLKTYHNYVKFEDLWHPFASFLSNQSYAGQLSAYIPEYIPSVTPAFLYCFLRSHGTYNAYKLTGYSASGANVKYHASAANSTVATGSDLTSAISYLVGDWNSLYSFDGTNYFTTTALAPPGVCDLDGNLTPEASDWCEVINDGTDYYLICGRFGQFSKNLMKILIGCGYELNLSIEPVSMLPLFAYFKTWFDLFMPARDKTWDDTNAHAFMEYVEQTNRASFSSWVSNGTAYSRFINFLNNLPYCYYTQNVDYAAAHIDGVANAIGSAANGSNSINGLDYSGNNDSSSVLSVNQRPVKLLGDISGNPYLDQNSLNLLKVLDRRVNIQSAVGGRIHELLKSIYGSNYDDHQSNFIGTQELSAQIDDVMSTAETTTGYLGEYAGKGLGSSPGNDFHFEAHDGTKFGYLVTVACVVPYARMSQGMDPQLDHLTREDFYTRDLDGMTLKPTAKKFIYGSIDVSIPSGSYSDLDLGFGNLPVYTEYKYKKNITSGDMRMMSTRSSYLPYTLDKLLPYSYIHRDTSGSLSISNMDLAFVVNGSKWRYIGLQKFLGNYDRIFVESGNNDVWSLGGIDANGTELMRFNHVRIDDNFIVHNYFDYTKLSHAIAMADSWQTDAYGDHLSLEES